MLIALLVTLNASAIAGIFSAAPEDAAHLPTAVALFAWALPLWTFVEVATSAARARRAFGPEIRLRIFWEQLARIVFAIGFFALGFHSFGLMLAHLCSLALTAALCVPLLGRYYDLRLLLRAPIPAGLARNLLASGAGLLPSNLARRLLIDAPALVLNLMFPGAAGAAAAGLFEIARKLSTVPYVVRQAFQYVLGPLSSAQAHADRDAGRSALSFRQPRLDRARRAVCRACSSSPAPTSSASIAPRRPRLCLCSGCWSPRAASRRSSGLLRPSSR